MSLSKGARIGEDGEDLKTWLVSEGWAVSYKHYSKSYVPLEIQAQEAKKGIWSGKFKDPEKWRKEHNGRTGARKIAAQPAVAAAPAATAVLEKIIETETSSAVIEKLKTAIVITPSLASTPTSDALSSTTRCEIKGNITAKGLKIYHVPGGRYYDAVKIDTQLGERFFCIEEEAVAAGWRASKG